jgi:hypothetical protein
MTAPRSRSDDSASVILVSSNVSRFSPESVENRWMTSASWNRNNGLRLTHSAIARPSE